MEKEQNKDFIGESVKKAQKELGHANILIAGISGVGKSSLLNAVFGENKAETGVGRPVTTGLKKYEMENSPISIYDTVGFELDDNTSGRINGIIDFVKDPKNEIKIIWYCVSIQSGRFQIAEHNLLLSLCKAGVDIVIVFTRDYQEDLPDCDPFVERTKKELVDYSVEFVRCNSVEFKGHPKKGIKELVNITAESLPKEQKKAFIATQIADLGLKIKAARAAMALASGLAAAAGANPFPIPDAGLLVPIQCGMLAGISACMGLDLSSGAINTIIASVVGGGGATLAGKELVKWLTKMLPLGGIINAAVASGFTLILGETYIELLKEMIENGKEYSPMEMADLLKERLNSNIQKWTKKESSTNSSNEETAK